MAESPLPDKPNKRRFTQRDNRTPALERGESSLFSWTPHVTQRSARQSQGDAEGFDTATRRDSKQ